MERQQLVKTLAELQNHLSQADRVDPETVAHLRKLTDDLDRLLDEEDPTTTEDVGPVSGGLRDMMLKFEADHPDLALAIGKVADGLAAMGI